VELNKFERGLLAKQYHILRLLDQTNADHYQKMQEALENGYEAVYETLLYETIADVLPAGESTLVIEAMDMYSAIQRSYDALDDKTGIEEERTKFPGFDSDFELAHLGYARFVVEREGRFSQLKAHSEDYMSHRPMLDQYRRMTDVWKLAANRYELTRDDIAAILDA
jgi:uncharacterized protein YfbU (UPF0304 family)